MFCLPSSTVPASFSLLSVSYRQTYLSTFFMSITNLFTLTSRGLDRCDVTESVADADECDGSGALDQSADVLQPVKKAPQRHSVLCPLHHHFLYALNLSQLRHDFRHQNYLTSQQFPVEITNLGFFLHCFLPLDSVIFHTKVFKLR